MAEVSRAVNHLLEAAHFFSSCSEGAPKNPKVAIQCLYTALSLVLPPSREAEIRIILGEMLLKFTNDLLIALDHLQKAHRLLQTVSFEPLMIRRCESALILGLLQSNTVNLALPLIDEALKRSFESSNWDDFVHFYIYSLKARNDSGITIPRDQLDHFQSELLDTFQLLRNCCCLNNVPTIDEVISLEGGIIGSKLAGLKCACSLIMRLKLGLSESFKTVAMICKKMIADMGDRVDLPGGFMINGPAFKEILQKLLVLAQIRFQLPEIDVNEQEPSLFDVELRCIQSRISARESRQALSAIQEALWSTSCGVGDLTSLGALMPSGSATDTKLRLWNVQLLLQRDVYEARNSLFQLQSEASFEPNAYSCLLEALILYKCKEPVHRTKEALLNSLRILNSSSTRDDVLKLCVMVLLAEIYQNTDFSLAEKMAATAYSYSRKLGNHMMALHSGLILEQMYILKGDDVAAASQQKLNKDHRNIIAL